MSQFFSSIGDNQSKLLFATGTINTATSWYTIMQYALSHHLSYAAIEDLIKLVKVSIRSTLLAL